MKARATKASAAQKAQAKKAKQKAQREKAQAKGKALREKALQKKAQLRAQKERERLQAQKERQRQKAARELQRARAEKQRERERQTKAKAKEREQQQKERERKRQAILREKERARQRKEQEAKKARLLAERKAAREAANKARALEREQKRAAKEAERQRILAEREAEREEARRKREEERARKEAEREAYRKAKEAERERVRAEREAARRALEGRIARASKRALRAAGRGSTRVYRPEAIPNQAGTTRRPIEGLSPPVPQTPVPRPPSEHPEEPAPPTPPVDAQAVPPEPPVAPPESIEDRYALILERLAATDDTFRREYAESFDMSWIYHDSALEGVVYTFQELKTAIDPSITVVPDSSLQPVCEEIRRHKAALELVKELAERKRVPISIDVIKRLYLTLHPEEGDLKSVKYRKDIPQHRLYFHEYAPPDKIAYRVRQVIDWLNGPEPKKIRNVVRIATRVHYDLVRIFPFPIDSGKVARLLMNLLLLRAGYPPAIIHSTERQRYYEALKGALPVLVNMVSEAIVNGLASVEKRLDEQAQGVAHSAPQV